MRPWVGCWWLCSHPASDAGRRLLRIGSRPEFCKSHNKSADSSIICRNYFKTNRSFLFQSSLKTHLSWVNSAANCVRHWDGFFLTSASISVKFLLSRDSYSFSVDLFYNRTMIILFVVKEISQPSPARFSAAASALHIHRSFAAWSTENYKSLDSWIQ